MQKASIAELKARLSEYLAAARRGEEVLVTDRGRPVAKLTPIRGAASKDARAAELARAGLLRMPTAKLPANFWERKRPRDTKGRSQEIMRQEREQGW